jgi:uncharacterized protein (DUF2236 family)
VVSEDGYFPRGSMLRRVQGERSVGLLYGQRALMLGAMTSPLSYYGTARHTYAKAKPFQRLVHTGKVFETIFFGTREDADKALAFVRRMHEKVKGTLPEALGPWPAGTHYSAFDPELMLAGVVAPAFDSAQACYEALARPLTDDEREQLWQDFIRFGELFGMPRDVAPQSYSDFRGWWRELLAGDRAFLTEEARTAGFQTGFGIPVPRANRPGMRVLELLLLGTLPPRAREQYRLPWGLRERIAFDAAAAAMRRSRTVTPRRLRRGSCEFFLDLVAKTERQRLRAGQEPAMFKDAAAA